MEYTQSLTVAVDQILKWTGHDLQIGLPLGLGKPNLLANEIYHRAKSNKNIKLQIFSALSLDVPAGKSDLEKAFLKPFTDRHFGENYPHLQYVKDEKTNAVPDNIKIEEFYLQPAGLTNSAHAQKNYISVNYTHAANALFDKNINVVIQLVSKRSVGGVTKYSLGTNPDLTLDLKDLYFKKNKSLKMIGVVSSDMPYFGQDAEVDDTFFDLILEDPLQSQSLFGIPKEPIDATDFMIGLHASRLIADDGTLQIGIGSLSDSLVHSTLIRHQKNPTYLELIGQLPSPKSDRLQLHSGIFQQGLYGTSELVMDGFMYLRKAHILKRKVQDKKNSYYLHGAFVLGSKALYDWMRSLKGEDFEGLCMTRVSKVNDLYDADETALRRQRKNARFFNTCMQMSLLGAASSDTLGNGTVISGVGGQFNFVTMAHELENARSILLLRSSRKQNGKTVSNIVWSIEQTTIPRHLRDIVITEYGIADLRGQSDEQVIRALIEISDSKFQAELIQIAKNNGKLSKTYELPESAKNNSSEKIDKFIEHHRSLFPAFPFGSDFTPTEEKIVFALLTLKNTKFDKMALLRLFFKGLGTSPNSQKETLTRMNLLKPQGLKNRLYQKLLLGALQCRHK